jgi:hypothetical protein
VSKLNQSLHLERAKGAVREPGGTTDSLPNDLESLRALAAQVIAERDVAIAECEMAIKQRDEKAKLAAAERMRNDPGLLAGLAGQSIWRPRAIE